MKFITSITTHAWYIIAGIFYATLVICGIMFLAGGGYFARTVGSADFLLMSLAVWRLTRLFTYDAITQFVRDWFKDSSPESLGGALYTLLTCPWCTGLWFGMVVVFAYFYTPYTWPVLLILAVSVVGSFLQVLANLVGWSAELKKHKCEESGSDSHTCRA